MDKYSEPYMRRYFVNLYNMPLELNLVINTSRLDQKFVLQWISTTNIYFA